MGLLKLFNIFVRARRSLRDRSPGGRATANDLCVHGGLAVMEESPVSTATTYRASIVHLPLLHSVPTAAGLVGRRGTVLSVCSLCRERSTTRPLIKLAFWEENSF